MNAIIEETIKKGILVTTEYNKETLEPEHVISGFYKSGDVRLIENGDGTLKAVARYNQEDTINNFFDLLALNYYWWDYSKDRSDGWKEPDSRWLPHLLESGLVKEKIETIKSYY